MQFKLKELLILRSLTDKNSSLITISMISRKFVSITNEKISIHTINQSKSFRIRNPLIAYLLTKTAKLVLELIVKSTNQTVEQTFQTVKRTNQTVRTTQKANPLPARNNTVVLFTVLYKKNIKINPIK